MTTETTIAPTESELPGAAVDGAETVAPDVTNETPPESKPVPEHRTAPFRFSELTAKAREAQAQAQLASEEAAYWRGIAEGRGVAPQPSSAQPTASGPPDPAQYTAGEFDPKYIKDVAKWELREEYALAQRQAVESQEFETRKARWQQAVAEVRNTFDHYANQGDGQQAQAYQAGEQLLRQAPTQIADAICAAPAAHLVAAYLAVNPNHLQSVAQMDVYARAAELGRIGQILASRQTAPPPAADPTPMPSAPTPIPTAPGRGSAPAFDPNRASVAEFVAMHAQITGRK